MAVDAKRVEINRGYLEHFKRWSSGGASDRVSLSSRLRYGKFAQLLCLPFLPFVSVLVIGRLLLWRLFRRDTAISPLHQQALHYVGDFVEQYPLHLYPIVAKSLELAILRAEVAKLSATDRVLEVAIGDGTLSRRVFSPQSAVTGIDLSPYDLVKAARLPYVKTAIVCDGLYPPFAPGSFDVLIANNFLHHVTQKSRVLAAWSRVATRLVFTENSRAWATGWPLPYLLRRAGLPWAADRAADRIGRRTLQSLLPLAEIDAIVASAGQVKSRASFLSERTFFYCGLFSVFLRCYGPPTPALFKRLALGPLRGLVIPTTALIARLLIEFDAAADRERDTFVQLHVRADWRRACFNHKADLSVVLRRIG